MKLTELFSESGQVFQIAGGTKVSNNTSCEGHSLTSVVKLEN